jgi:hypothetical protein
MCWLVFFVIPRQSNFLLCRGHASSRRYRSPTRAETPIASRFLLLHSVPSPAAELRPNDLLMRPAKRPALEQKENKIKNRLVNPECIEITVLVIIRMENSLPAKKAPLPAFCVGKGLWKQLR